MIAPNTKPPKAIRCAIYTRKSTSEGLEQEFSTLDAQRESASAYIASQRGEGWVELETRYDDGGFTGGNMERPALKRLLADIKAGKVDCVVVYKVDRLSRSLLDFSRIMETLDNSGCSFVSVTQQFNTTSSMGRLTLNILLSFAQFEREIISERTRDKMGAARRKGKYVGGRPLLGYDVDSETKRLVVNEPEAVRVRQIFDLYLEHGGLVAASRAISERGWRTKSWITKTGRMIGDVPITKTRLYAMLTNPLYIGRVLYQDHLYEGEHEAIIDAGTFERVRAMLKKNRIATGDRVEGRSSGVLAGLLHCTACECRMTHSTSGGAKRGKTYRYYVCGKAQKRGHAACPRPSLPAEQVERFVVRQLQSLTIDEDLLREACNRVRRLIDAEQQRLADELAGLATEIRSIEREVKRLSTPMENPASDAVRPESLADLNDQHRRREWRRASVEEQLDGKPMPERAMILQAISDLETLWDHLTSSEKTRPASLVIERVDHDPGDSTFSITLTPTGLRTLGTGPARQEATA